MAKPRITQTTHTIAQELQFSDAKNLGEIPQHNPQRERQIEVAYVQMAIFDQYLARWGHSYYRRLIGTHMRSIEWRYFQRPWMTPNNPRLPNFLHFPTPFIFL